MYLRYLWWQYIYENMEKNCNILKKHSVVKKETKNCVLSVVIIEISEPMTLGLSVHLKLTQFYCNCWWMASYFWNVKDWILFGIFLIRKLQEQYEKHLSKLEFIFK